MGLPSNKELWLALWLADVVLAKMGKVDTLSRSGTDTSSLSELDSMVDSRDLHVD